jgi:hypothetical protein
MPRLAKRSRCKFDFVGNMKIDRPPAEEVIRLSTSRILRERLGHLRTSLAELDSLVKGSVTSEEGTRPLRSHLRRLAFRIRGVLWPELDIIHNRLLRSLDEQNHAIEALASAVDLQSLRQHQRLNNAIDAIESAARHQGMQIGDIEKELFALCRRAASLEDLAETVEDLVDRDLNIARKPNEFIAHPD